MKEPKTQKKTTPLGTIYSLFADKNAPEFQADAKRIFEKKNIRKLLESALNTSDPEILYTQKGQPYLPGFPEQFLSISHSNGWFTTYLSKKQAIGIDIQTFTSSLERGLDYFFNKHELLQFGEIPSREQAYLTWCAKEAFYKRLGGEIINVRDVFTIKQITGENAGYITLSFKEQTYLLEFELDEQKALVWTID